MEKVAKSDVLVNAVVEAAYRHASPNDPLLRRCGGKCRQDLMLALPFLMDMGIPKTRIAEIFGVKPQQVIREVEHLADEYGRDPETIRRKITLIRNHIFHNTGIKVPMPVV